MGLVDKVAAPAVLTDTAVALALSGTARPFKQRATAWATHTWPARKLLAPQMRKQVARKARKETLPGAIRADRRVGTQAAAAVSRRAWTPSARRWSSWPARLPRAT